MKRPLIKLATVAALTLVSAGALNSMCGGAFAGPPYTKSAESSDIGTRTLQSGATPAAPNRHVPDAAHSAPTAMALRVHVELGRNSHSQPELGLVVIDPEGHRSGIDVRHNKTYREIPGSNAEYIVRRDHAGVERGVVLVSIQPATTTVYSMEMSGREGKPGNYAYELTVYGVSPMLRPLTHVRNARVSMDTLVRYRINLANIDVPRMGAYVVTDPTKELFWLTEERQISPTDPTVLNAPVNQDPCGHFMEALRTLPHEKLTRSDGILKSLWGEEERYDGCRLVLITNDTLMSGHNRPNFSAYEGGELYRMGWRPDGRDAMGPGTSFSGIENNSHQCLIRSEQPAQLDDKGNIVASETLELTIECKRK